jgi:hypothetical protein
VLRKASRGHCRASSLASQREVSNLLGVETVIHIRFTERTNLASEMWKQCLLRVESGLNGKIIVCLAL